VARIDSLLREREGYVLRNLQDRVAQVDAEIKRLTGVVVDDNPAADVVVEFEVASFDPPEQARRGPGRPRKVRD